MAKGESGNGKLWIILILVLLIALVSIGISLWMVLDHNDSTSSKKVTTAKVEQVKPIFYNLEPFTVNLQDGDNAYQGSLLYVKVTLQLGDKQSETFIKENLPSVRDRLLLVLSGQHSDVLVTREGKKNLSQSIRNALLKPFTDNQPELKVDKVLFTQFIVQ